MSGIIKFKHYFLNLILIWAAIAIYKSTSYYLTFLRSETQTILLYLAIAYTILGFLFYLLTPENKIKKSKGVIIFYAIARISEGTIKYFKSKKTPDKKPFPKLEKQEKTALLFVFVKFFFLPIMLNFFLNNYFALKSNVHTLTDLSTLFTIQGFNFILFPFLLASIFFIDTLWFAFGYAFEATLLKNTIRSVEPTFIGWFVALICYPPFNGTLTKYINWYANDYVLFFNDTITFIARIIVILLLSIYVSATLALGAKSSNLTNRGIVTRGPYSIIRHPAYISKNLAWWITVIPVISWPAILSAGVWSFIYHMRTITE
ncbi:MAG: hypothetical protein KKB31_04805, partial [Nanoarchaeota archaeon]|nr:hypothetical protein [Nanoarchaeota archaeon]